ncbi:MAG: histidine kinase [Actinomycetia bacterium]|nr:histidine kinase [Actinomycetes bacterium]
MSLDPRDAVRSTIGALFSSDRFPEEQYDEPAGDEGLFGPGSVAWRVHADASMFVGGIAALMLQSLHPRAAAVVASSSNFRERPLHRLSRTGSFVAATTFAATPVAEAIIARVRAVHARIPGASDPDLLTWIHVAEVTSFLAAYRRYHPSLLFGPDIDRYLDETAVVAERLGATGVPRSAAAVRAYYGDVRPELGASEHSDDLMAFLHQPLSRNPAARAVYELFLQAAEAQLPGWARRMYGMHLPPGADRLLLQPATGSVLAALRLALGSSPVLAAARARATAVAA